MKSCHAATWLLCILLLACQPETNMVLTYDLSPKTYAEKIHCIGRLTSANNYTIVVPRVYGPSAKVIELTDEGLFASAGDTICILESTDMQGFFDQYYDELDKAKADLIKQEANNALQVSMLDAQLKENEIKASLTRFDSLQLKFAPPVRKKLMELELQKSDITKKKITKKLLAQQRINEQTVRALKSQIIQKEQLVQRFQDMLDELIIIAPKEGMIVHCNSPEISFSMGGGGGGTMGGKTRLGASLMSDMPLIELPDLDSMQIVTMLQEADFKRVEKGQRVIIRPESLKGIEIPGTIKSKSLVSKPMSYEFKVKTYEVIIDVDSLDNLLLPGLSAKCEIIIQSEPDTIVAPSISIFEKDSSKIVYVFENELFSPVKIETGLSNMAETIISKGLTGNETIALTEPPYKLILKTDKPEPNEK